MKNVPEPFTNIELPIIADGAMGTQLMASGFNWEDGLERLNIEHPEVIAEIHRSYIKAGAQLLTTNTFGATPYRLTSNGMERNYREINRSAVDRARNAGPDDTKVAFSLGPCFNPDVEIDDNRYQGLLGNYHAQLEIGLERGIDLVLIETVIRPEEANAAIQAARDLNKTIPIWLTLAVQTTEDGVYTYSGVPVKDLMSKLNLKELSAFGVNCGEGFEAAVDQVNEISSLVDLPMIANPSAGLPEQTDDGVEFPITPDEAAWFAEGLKDQGVSVIGGCCGTTPEHIAAINKQLKG